MAGFELNKCSVAFLRPSTVECLAIQLNPTKHLLTRANRPGEKRRLRDWRGVYEETCLTLNKLAWEKIKQSSDHFKQFLEQWKHHDEATVAKLFEILETLDRYDVIDDNKQRILEDVKTAENLLKVKGLSLGEVENRIAGSEQVLTYDDIAMLKKSLGVAKYDVLILHADEDLQFAERMVQVLEQQNIKVCLKDRDLLVGTLELDAVTSLISERCNKVAVLLTPQFFSSSCNKFYSVLAQCRAITENKRSFLPIVHNNQTNLPTNIGMLTKLSTSNPYFWSKLCMNINENFRESPDNPLPKNFADNSYNTTTPYSLPQLSQPNISNNIPPISMKKSTSVEISSPLSDSPQPHTTSTQKDTGSSIRKLFKSFSTDVRNKLTKKGKNGHQLFKNEPEFTGIEELSSSDQISLMNNAPTPPSQDPSSSGYSSRKQADSNAKTKRKGGKEYEVFAN